MNEEVIEQNNVFRHLRQTFCIQTREAQSFSVYVVSVLINVNHFSILRRTITYLGCVLTQFSGKDTSTKRLSFCC